MINYILIISIIWIFFCLFSVNYLTLTSVCSLLIMYLLYMENIYVPLILLAVTLLSASIFRTLFWREFYRKPKFWKRIEILLCSIVSFFIFVFVIIPQSNVPNFEILDFNVIKFIILNICFVFTSFLIVKMFVVELLFFLINQCKTESKQIVTGKVKRIFSNHENKFLSHYMVMDNSNENIKINIITMFYLKSFAENKTIEIEFKKGFLGLEYSNRFPKIVS